MQSRSSQTALVIPSVDDSPGLKLLPFLLSIIAGSVDVIGFLGLGGLLTAHITGNLVILAARLVARDPAPLSYLIAVPVFVIALGITRLLAARLERIRIPSLVPLLSLHAVLLVGSLSVCVVAGSQAGPNSPAMILAGMLGVSAMAAQNGLARISIRGAPATAVMTTNVTVFIIDFGEIVLSGSKSRAARARGRARHTWPAIVGFVVGCAFGALCELVFGLQSLALPAGLALLAVMLGVVATQPSKPG